MKIAGHEYTINFESFELEGQIGEHNKRKTVITIDPSLDISTATETLLHEWVHAVLSHSGIYQDNKGKIPAEISFDIIANELYRTGMAKHIIDKITLNRIEKMK